MQSTVKDKKITLLYEIFIAILALIAVSISFLDLTGKISMESSKTLYNTDICILMIFSIDYVIRMVLSNNKKEFFKRNILDLIAIIPFNSLFRAFRIARLVRVARLSKLIRVTRFIRLLAFSKKFLSKADRFIHTNGFIYVIYLTIITILLGSIGIYYIEYGITINSFGDAIWWSFVTATTVGYGDISPTTTLGRIIAAILMIVGIGFIGMMTGTIATYFLNRKETINIDKCKEKIIDLSDFDNQEYQDVLKYIEFIKSKRQA